MIMSEIPLEFFFFHKWFLTFAVSIVAALSKSLEIVYITSAVNISSFSRPVEHYLTVLRLKFFLKQNVIVLK